MQRRRRIALKIESLSAERDGRPVVRDLDLIVRAGERCAVIEPAAGRRATLAHVLADGPGCRITGGRIVVHGADVTGLDAQARARKGLLLLRQPPAGVPGETIASWLRASLAAAHGRALAPASFRRRLRDQLDLLGMDSHFAGRTLAQFAPRDAKRFDLLHTAILKPHVAVFDETASGLDVDAWRALGDGLRVLGGHTAVVLCVLDRAGLAFVKPDDVFEMVDGALSATGRLV
jgi:Fe-S cluster assembly ATP-binding protein